MKDWLKELIYFLCLFIFSMIFTRLLQRYVQTGGLHPTYALVISSIILTSFMIGMYYILQTVQKNGKDKEGFHFEVTPEKQCSLYPYITPPAYTGIDCSKFTEKELSKYFCPGAYHGRPVQFKYTPESNSNWVNDRCQQAKNSKDDDLRPAVL